MVLFPEETNRVLLVGKEVLNITDLLIDLSEDLSGISLTDSSPFQYGKSVLEFLLLITFDHNLDLLTLNLYSSHSILPSSTFPLSTTHSSRSARRIESDSDEPLSFLFFKFPLYLLFLLFFHQLLDEIEVFE